MGRASVRPADARAEPRAESRIPATIVHDGGELHGEVRNLSGGGMLLAASALPVGTKVRVLVALPGLDAISSLEGTVRWSSARGELGVQLGSLRAQEVWALNRLTRTPR